MKKTQKTKRKKVQNKDTKRKSYDTVKSKKWTDIKNIKTKILDKIQPEHTYLIRMQLKTGDHTEFLINESKSYFIYKGGKYIIDSRCCYYVASSKRFALNYHQDFTLPFKININQHHVNELIKKGELAECEMATNPGLLDNFQNSSVMEKMMKAQEMDDFFKQIKLFLIVTAIASVINTIILVQSTGMLSSLKLPF